jgi:hypothetical protein
MTGASVRTRALENAHHVCKTSSKFGQTALISIKGRAVHGDAGDPTRHVTALKGRLEKYTKNAKVSGRWYDNQREKARTARAPLITFGRSQDISELARTDFRTDDGPVSFSVCLFDFRRTLRLDEDDIKDRCISEHPY